MGKFQYIAPQSVVSCTETDALEEGIRRQLHIRPGVTRPVVIEIAALIKELMRR
jgi:hypothetical protein